MAAGDAEIQTKYCILCRQVLHGSEFVLNFLPTCTQHFVKMKTNRKQTCFLVFVQIVLFINETCYTGKNRSYNNIKLSLWSDLYVSKTFYT